MKVISISYEKWEDMSEEEAMVEAIQVFRALEDNTTIEEVNLEHSPVFVDECLARAIARSLAKNNQSVEDVCVSPKMRTVPVRELGSQFAN